MVLLVTFTNFEPNLVLVNITKLKQYKYIESMQNFEIQTPIYSEETKTTD